MLCTFPMLLARVAFMGLKKLYGFLPKECDDELVTTQTFLLQKVA